MRVVVLGWAMEATTLMSISVVLGILTGLPLVISGQLLLTSAAQQRLLRHIRHEIRLARQDAETAPPEASRPVAWRAADAQFAEIRRLRASGAITGEEARHRQLEVMRALEGEQA